MANAIRSFTHPFSEAALRDSRVYKFILDNSEYVHPIACLKIFENTIENSLVANRITQHGSCM